VTRAVRETEGEAAESLLEDLDERLAEAALADNFTYSPVEAQVERIRAELGLAADSANDPEPLEACADTAVAAARRPALHWSG
jgi:hypothetical protein